MYFGDIHVVRSKSEPIPGQMLNPHYTDERFTRSSGGLTIFLAQGLVAAETDFGTETVEGAHYNFSDRIWQGYSSDKVETAHLDAQEEIGNSNTAAYYESMLRKVYDDPTTVLQHMIAGVNRMNGFSYHVYGTMSENSPTANQ